MDMFKLRILTCILLIMAVAGCQTTPKNSHPSCEPCTKYVDFAQPVEACPAFSPQSVTPYRRWRHMVLEGGGVKGVAYAGAFAALSDAGAVDDIEHVAGTSAGALMALAFSLGYSADEIQQIVLQLDFKKFRDGTLLGNSVRLVRDYGLYKGNYAQCVMECLVQRQLGDKKANFLDLHAQAQQPGSHFRDAVFYGTDVQ